jgi:hypothetical protein
VNLEKSLHGIPEGPKESKNLTY